MSSQTDIQFNVSVDGEAFEVATRKGEYRNLMVLLYDKFYFDGFGECKGIGRCGTCHVQLKNAGGKLLIRVGNEDTTLSKMPGVTQNSRLACQIMIDEKLDGLTIEVASPSEN